MSLRLNVGCGAYALKDFVNIDERGDVGVDVVISVPPLRYRDCSVREIYCGHFLEHLERAQADEFLSECWRVLEPGGRLGILVPDMLEVMRRYVLNQPAPVEFPSGVHRDLRDLDDMCAVVIFSTDQPSHHQWAYDALTLGRLLERHGFLVDGEFDRFTDPRIGVGAWYQVGVDCHKPHGSAAVI